MVLRALVVLGTRTRVRACGGVAYSLRDSTASFYEILQLLSMRFYSFSSSVSAITLGALPGVGDAEGAE